MKAVILAGGKGTRLRPLTHAIPKPMLPIHGRPMLEQILLHLKKHGVTEFIITVGYLGYQIKNYFRDGSDIGVHIEYAEEEEPKGTAGCLLPFKEKLTETFLLVGGDNITNLDYGRFIEFHKEQKAMASIALTPIEVPIEFGVYEVDDKKKVTSFREKPVLKHLAGTMIFCLEPGIVKEIPDGFSNLTDHILPKLLAKGAAVYGYPFDDFWADVGRIEDYNKFV